MKNVFMVSSLLAATTMSMFAHANNGELSYNDWAVVQSAQPVYATVHPREECVETYEQRPSISQQQTGSNTVGKVIGGLLGAGLGSQIGKGKGNTIATATGAILGAELGGEYLGGGATESAQPVRTVRCKTIPGETYISGYTLTVVYEGRIMNVSYPSNVPVGYLIPVTVNVIATGGQPIPPQYQQPHLSTNTSKPRQR